MCKQFVEIVLWSRTKLSDDGSKERPSSFTQAQAVYAELSLAVGALLVLVFFGLRLPLFALADTGCLGASAAAADPVDAAAGVGSLRPFGVAAAGAAAVTGGSGCFSTSAD